MDKADLQGQTDELSKRERQAGCETQRFAHREEALAERLQLASRREQSLLERETAVAAREEDVTNAERAFREGMRRSRQSCEPARRDMDREALDEKARMQEEQDQHLAERERRVVCCEERFRVQKAECMRQLKEQEASLVEREEKLQRSVLAEENARQLEAAPRRRLTARKQIS
ncbi:unnamed protein product [Effrenium voratum]|uniref:Uncharacterized protein n=1 Tax=Effrenium voratum TaxID=2562239 RepID=A0AA36HW15_9DINO|nr:unnamed protein product [Effrenium voratum]CAJ1443784.1 unnamed protein product [Effrenium voratum]